MKVRIWRPCKVAWCVAMTTDGHAACAVHRHWPDLHPESLSEEDAETIAEASRVVIDNGRAYTKLVSVPTLGCDECDGTGDCGECNGNGETECECECGDAHQRECDECEGTGRCQSCDAAGLKPDAYAIVHPAAWSWSPEYRRQYAAARGIPSKH